MLILVILLTVLSFVVSCHYCVVLLHEEQFVDPIKKQIWQFASNTFIKKFQF